MDIFVTNDGSMKNVTKTTILEMIPDRTVKYDKDWRKKKLTQWKWRFLTINQKPIVEISYKRWYSNSSKYYIISNNKWLTRIVDPIYDQFVTDVYYYYTS